MAQKLKVLKADESYTFSKFFELPFEIEDVLADLDCSVHPPAPHPAPQRSSLTRAGDPG
jgi:hypothetical protein